MANVQSVNRRTTPFVPDSKIIFTIPLGGKIRRGMVILTGSIVVSGGTANGTVVGEGGPINLVQRIIVTATRTGSSRYPGGKIVDCAPRSLLRYAETQHNGKFIGEQSGSTLGNGANGTYPIYLAIPIPFADDTLKAGMTAANQLGYSTALNTDVDASTGAPNYASVQVEVDTGDLTTCFTGNNASVNWNGLQVQWDDDRIAFSGDTVVRYMEDHLMLIAAAETRAMDQAMPQDGAFQSWLIMGEQGAARTLSNTLLNRLTLSGPTISYDRYSGDIQQYMLDDEWIDPSQSFPGLYYINFTDGSLGNSVPASGLDVKFDVNNPSGANADQLRIFTQRIFAPTPASTSGHK